MSERERMREGGLCDELNKYIDMLSIARLPPVAPAGDCLQITNITLLRHFGHAKQYQCNAWTVAYSSVSYKFTEFRHRPASTDTIPNEFTYINYFRNQHFEDIGAREVNHYYYY